MNSRSGSSTTSGSRSLAAPSSCVRTTSSGARVVLMGGFAAYRSYPRVSGPCAHWQRPVVMPELPEVEITARLIGEALSSVRVESALTPGINALKSYDPPLSAIEGCAIEGVRRRGKLFVIDFSDELSMLVHLMSAGRLQLFDKRASLRDRTSRLLLRLDDGRELRLREFGTKQRAWVKLLSTDQVEAEETIAALGPEAWPDPPAFDDLLDQPRPLYALMRDQHVIAGIGRSWVDEILHAAQVSPFKRGSDLEPDEAERLRQFTVAKLGEVIARYEQAI